MRTRIAYTLHRYTYKLANSNDNDNNIAMNQSDNDERISDNRSETTYDGSNSTEGNSFSFDYNSSDKFETLRKSEAADIIPDLTNDFISECLNMITHKGKTAEDRRAMLTKWIQATQPQ